ncbi:unnamed protein product [Phaedon cochleariae]|uniref:Uronyl 2-sulfotransferase n=1 Tax=Phaedon cochleariae TaxID=80249 RepID=A0A9P0DKN4_PHACE|nr:unnamed protein product [Phaedon cochleariae]
MMRFYKNIQWLALTVIFTILLSGSFFLRNRHERTIYKTSISPTKSALSLAPLKHVTKSIAELGKMDEINKYFLLLNNVPKCGSEILVLLLQKLQGLNNYRHVRLKEGNKRHLTNLQQEYLVYDMFDMMKRQAVPLSFDRHVYFINFTNFDRQFPTYINLLRNPVDKVISRTSFKGKDKKQDYYYKCLMHKKNNCNYKNGQPYDLSIPYFCGHDPRCQILNNDWALQTARSNVEKYYPVVGILEELNATLEILETKIPYFFKGAQKTYEKYFIHIQKSHDRPKAPRAVKRKLEETLIHEMDFYEWNKARLFKQLKILYGEHPSH